MRVAAIVPAAGKGKRLKSNIDKPYIKVCGKPIAAYTLLTLSKNKNIKEIIVAVNKDKINKFKKEIINKFKLKKVSLVIGGKERKDSVSNALKVVSKDIDYILIHDCVRPFITNNLIESSLRKTKKFGASVVAIPVKYTLKYVRKDYIQDTPDRRKFWEAQTPQVFRKDLIEKAYEKTKKKSIDITDDSMLVEKLGIRPKVVLGSYGNIKITTSEDIKLAKILCKK